MYIVIHTQTHTHIVYTRSQPEENTGDTVESSNHDPFEGQEVNNNRMLATIEILTLHISHVNMMLCVGIRVVAHITCYCYSYDP